MLHLEALLHVHSLSRLVIYVCHADIVIVLIPSPHTAQLHEKTSYTTFDYSDLLAGPPRHPMDIRHGDRLIALGPSPHTSQCRKKASYTTFDLLRPTQIAKFMGPTWGPPGSCRPQMGPMLAPWTLLSGYLRTSFLLVTTTRSTW